MNSDDLRIEFGERLRRLRIERGHKSATGFAEALGLEENRYMRYERGEVEPGLETIIQICRLLETEPNTLLGFTAKD